LNGRALSFSTSGYRRIQVVQREELETIIQKRGVAIMASAGVREIRPGERVSW